MYEIHVRESANRILMNLRQRVCQNRTIKFGSSIYRIPKFVNIVSTQSSTTTFSSWKIKLLRAVFPLLDKSIVCCRAFCPQRYLSTSRKCPVKYRRSMWNCHDFFLFIDNHSFASSVATWLLSSTFPTESRNGHVLPTRSCLRICFTRIALSAFSSEAYRSDLTYPREIVFRKPEKLHLRRLAPSTRCDRACLEEIRKIQDFGDVRLF